MPALRSDPGCPIAVFQLPAQVPSWPFKRTTTRMPAIVHEPTASVAVSVMLLGGLAFFMSLFYLVNWKDRDIRRYSWMAISSTISIFCAVLVFQSVSGSLDYFFSAAEGSLDRLALSAVQVPLRCLNLWCLLALLDSPIALALKALLSSRNHFCVHI